MNKTQITTGKVRFSYVHAFEPHTDQSGNEKYSVTLLIPKRDKQTLAKIEAAIENAKKNFKEKNPGKKLPSNLSTTLHDGDGEKVNSPLPGVIVEVSVKEGQAVKAGQKVAVLEAMKMENEIPAPKDGTITAIHVNKGDSILEGAPVVTIA